MPQNTQRPRYFDGEFLRSGDFTDEQSYHIGMRRLLNQEFDRSGIVRGLEIVQDQNSVPLPPPALSSQSATSPSSQSLALPVSFYSVTPGFAIDQIGREISVSAPYSLTPLLSRAGVTNAWYELWIVYTETMSGSPVPGYQLCNQLSQNTRWDESFDLVLRPLGVAPDPNVPDPNHDLKGLCLAVLQVVSSSISGLQFFVPSDSYRRRRYARIRAQSIIAPNVVDPDTVNFYGPPSSPQNTPPPYGPVPDGYIHIRTPNGVVSDGNVFVRNNMLVGEDFALDYTTVAGASLPSPPLPSPGNLKVGGDLFVNGQIFEKISNTWTTLGAYIKTLVTALPDVQLASVMINCGGKLGTFTQNSASISTNLPSFSRVDVQASISGVQFVNQAALNVWVNSIHHMPAQITNLTGVSVPAQATPAVPVQIQVSVDINGDTTLGFLDSIFQTVEVALIVIFRP